MGTSTSGTDAGASAERRVAFTSAFALTLALALLALLLRLLRVLASRPVISTDSG